MNRRDVLKNLTYGLGLTVATPTIMNILASCTAKTKPWNPSFLSVDEKHIVTHLMDIIIPKTDTPGALDINAPQFLDLMYFEIETPLKQELFKKGAALFSEKFSLTYNKTIPEGEKEDFEALLSTYFNLSEEETELLMDEQKLDIDKIDQEKIDNYSLYNFLLSVKYYTLFGYCTSEKIGKEIFAYDPVPGIYKGCISVEEATHGRPWSL